MLWLSSCLRPAASCSSDPPCALMPFATLFPSYVAQQAEPQGHSYILCQSRAVTEDSLGYVCGI